MKIQLTNLKQDVECIGKHIKMSKKRFVWEFHANFVKDQGPNGSDAPASPERAKYQGQNLMFKIELKDSISSGKKTISLNGAQIVKDVKIMNFGITPYLIQKHPVNLKIVKSQKTGSHELLIDDYSFTSISQHGIIFEYKSRTQSSPLSQPWLKSNENQVQEGRASSSYQQMNDFNFQEFQENPQVAPPAFPQPKQENDLIQTQPQKPPLPKPEQQVTNKKSSCDDPVFLEFSQKPLSKKESNPFSIADLIISDENNHSTGTTDHSGQQHGSTDLFSQFTQGDAMNKVNTTQPTQQSSQTFFDFEINNNTESQNMPPPPPPPTHRLSVMGQGSSTDNVFAIGSHLQQQQLQQPMMNQGGFYNPFQTNAQQQQQLPQQQQQQYGTNNLMQRQPTYNAGQLGGQEMMMMMPQQYQGVPQTFTANNQNYHLQSLINEMQTQNRQPPIPTQYPPRNMMETPQQQLNGINDQFKVHVKAQEISNEKINQSIGSLLNLE